MVHLTVEERAEMIRGHIGVVTALIEDDRAAVSAQVLTLAAQELEASGGSVREFAERMAKHVEAGARVTRQLLSMLAPRMQMSEQELLVLLAAAFHDPQFVDSLPE